MLSRIRAENKKELIGYVKLIALPYKEKLGNISREDIDQEGYPELSKEEFLNKFFSGKDVNSEVWVISFEFIPLTDNLTNTTQSDNSKTVVTSQQFNNPNKSDKISDSVSDTNSGISDNNDNEGFELSSDSNFNFGVIGSQSSPLSVSLSKIDDSYQLIENDEDLVKSIELLTNEKVLGIDTETTGLDPHLHKLRLVQIASVNNPTFLIDCFKCDVKLLQPLLLNEAVKVFHNAKFDIQFLMSKGLEINQTIFDTQLAHQLINSGKPNIKASLKAIASEYLGIELSKQERLTDWTKEELTIEQLKYSSIDAKILLPLREKLKEAIITANLSRVAKIEFDCVKAVAMMEFNGMLLDVSQWQNILEDSQKRKGELEIELQAILKEKIANSTNNKSEQLTLIANDFEFSEEINLDSPSQLKEALNKADIKCDNTNSKTLKKLLPLNPEVLKPLLEYKKLSKLISSFGDSLLKKINPITGRLHGSYWQLGSQSGRFTSSEPNLQQIPRNKESRSCFVASPNHKLVIADYSQIELRIASEVANDRTMIEAYNRGEDLHKLTASIVLNKPLDEVTKEDRQIAKSANFGLIYGASVNGFRGYAESNYGISLSESEAKTIMDNFFKSYSGLANWHKKTKSRIYNQGINETRTLSDRIRYFDNASPQQILNTPIQGTGADMVKLALGKLVSALTPFNGKARILATVHDEIILEAHESIAEDVAKILSEVMVSSGKEFLKLVPIEADSSMGDNWADK
ncbi:bifunctional 3'-5' exonuclease/DNA polymerase [Geminocystis sp. NIES-3709]|uniref:bifunctional 3'-5' exonuclease/DNA polymerase n=1 Tax=Geminocystis sp. NIES-3709 TaxID=1617448 RepID=UPI0005FC878A|nr:bifunctional 3'-5' exonuclease/DNA polymerase [Geminocystis sp. NIES-3709]BAQ66934.1 DNA polymerase I [Geminocystis sp. NIES-3709]